MRIAVLFSPGAGNRADFGRIGAALAARFKGASFYAASGPWGLQYIPGALRIEADPEGDYKLALYGTIKRLLENGADMLVCVGGDGLASYAAEGLIRSGRRIPLLGIAAGTANVGPIVSGWTPLMDEGPFKLEYRKIGAIEVSIGGKHSAYAFNDAVIATTFLGTVDGRTENLSVRAMALHGQILAEEPDPNIAGNSFSIEKNGKSIPRHIERPSQIVVSPAWPNEFYGRAVSGVLCETPYSPLRGIVALLDSVLIRPEAAAEGKESFSRVDHLLFGPGDRIRIQGLSAAAEVVIDGNPFVRQSADSVDFAYIPSLVQTVRVITAGHEKLEDQ